MGGETDAAAAAPLAVAAPVQDAVSTDDAQAVNIQLSGQLDFASFTPAANEAYLMLKLVAPLHETEERPSLDIVPVVDVSGSMSGAKLTLACETLEFIVQNLKPTDRMGLVAFDSNVRTVFNLTAMDASGKAKALDGIKQLRAGSCTNLSGGLFEGIDMMLKRSTKAQVSSVMLLTDGIANEGITDTRQLCETMKKLTGDNPDFTVYTFGYGADHNAEMLKQISEYANGMYYFIERNEIIPESFGDCLGGLLSVVGQNIKLTVKSTADGYKIKKLCMIRDHTLAADGASLTMSLGDLQSEEQRDVLLQVTLPTDVAEHADLRTVFTASIDYINLITSAPASATVDIQVSRPAEVPADRSPDAAMQDAIDRYKATEELAEARRLAEVGRLADARHVLSRGRMRMAERGHLSAMASNLCADMAEVEGDMLDQARWKSKGTYTAASAVQSHNQQRSNRVWADDDARGGYVTKNKARFRMMAKARK